MVVAKLVLRMNLMTMMMSLRRLMAFGLSALDLMELLLKETTLTLWITSLFSSLLDLSQISREWCNKTILKTPESKRDLRMKSRKENFNGKNRLSLLIMVSLMATKDLLRISLENNRNLKMAATIQNPVKERSWQLSQQTLMNISLEVMKKVENRMKKYHKNNDNLQNLNA